MDNTESRARKLLDGIGFPYLGSHYEAAVKQVADSLFAERLCGLKEAEEIAYPPLPGREDKTIYVIKPMTAEESRCRIHIGHAIARHNHNLQVFRNDRELMRQVVAGKTVIFSPDDKEGSE